MTSEDIQPLLHCLVLHKTIEHLELEAINIRDVECNNVMLLTNQYITDNDLIGSLQLLTSLRFFHINMCAMVSEDSVNGIQNLQRLGELVIGLNFTKSGQALSNLTRLTALRSLQLKDDFTTPQINLECIIVLKDGCLFIARYQYVGTIKTVTTFWLQYIQ